MRSTHGSLKFCRAFVCVFGLSGAVCVAEPQKSTAERDTLIQQDNVEFIGEYHRPRAIGIRPQIGFYDNPNAEEDQLTSIALRFNFNEHWSIRGAFGRAGDKDNQTAVTTVGGYYDFLSDQRFSPFVGVGIGKTGISRIESEISPAAMAGLRYAASDDVYAVLDATLLSSDGNLNSIYSIGAELALGGHIPVTRQAFYDSDGDGVPDDKDECPNTPPGTIVDERGCPKEVQVVRKGKTDSDGDGIPDYRDYCPGTQKGATADKYGCEWFEGVVSRAILDGINFNYRSSYLRKDAMKILKTLIADIADKPYTHIELDGHTDHRGSVKYNQWLSLRRAERAKMYMQKHGLEGHLMHAKGFGETQPIASNTTEAGMALNRRVLITVWNIEPGLKKRCPETPLPEGMQYPRGCPAPGANISSIDLDGDAVPDHLDLCKNTRPGARVNSKGCQVFSRKQDADADGVEDLADYCMNTKPNSKVDKLGCRIEADVAKRVLLEDVMFNSNSSNFTVPAIREMDTLVTWLMEHNFSRIVIEGHADSDSDAKYNQWLSERRADAVKKYLALEGVPVHQVSAVGYGESKPLVSNKSKQGKARNRRVLVTVYR